jgi:ankyrin repeat protein
MSLIDSNKHIELNNIDDALNTIMHHSEVINNDNIAKKLIQAGADTTIKNAKGESFLCKTALKGGDAAEEIVELALQQEENEEKRRSFDNAVFLELMNAFALLSSDEVKRRHNLLDMSKLIMKYGGDVDAVNENNETALFKAVYIKDLELIAFLLSAGVNPNIINNNGETVLLHTIYYGIKGLDILLLLLAYNADPLIQTKHFRTMYEILNDIILYLHNKRYIRDEDLINKIDKSGQYMVVLKELLKHNKKDLNILDSHGNPFFFDPLLYDDGQLFRLYINNGLNIHLVNKDNYNIFFAYVLKVFEDNTTKIEFQENLSRLISKKVNQNYQDSLGFTVLHKIVSLKCNNTLFAILTKIVKFDLTIVDNLGRSVIHNAVWSNNQNMIKNLNSIDNNIMNIEDNYGLLPITYAALLGSSEMVVLFIELKINVKGGHNIPVNAIKKFSPMLKNLSKLKNDTMNTFTLNKIDDLINQTQIDFNVPEFLRLK